MEDITKPQILEREDKPALAYIYSDGDADKPLVVFLGGFKSDMRGTKAFFLEQKCREAGHAYLRLDYSGHGESGGEFKDGTIGSWARDAADIIRHFNDEGRKLVVIGSSMGGWISLLLAVWGEFNIKGIIGIAAAPDFSKKFGPDFISPDQAKDLADKGYYLMPNEYDEPYVITRALLEDGDQNCLLDRTHDLGIPIHLLQGTDDAAVPVETAYAIQKSFGERVEISVIEGGDHSLSRPEDLALLWQKVSALSAA